MDFYLGQIFIDEYPDNLADWCMENSLTITEIEPEEQHRRFQITELPVIPITVQDYDRVMEEHIYNARYARGYTLREPTQFVTSSIPRWKQDAEDFVLFRDTVLAYGLEVMNHYAATGEAPTLDEFKNNLPNIVWTYSQ